MNKETPNDVAKLYENKKPNHVLKDGSKVYLG